MNPRPILISLTVTPRVAECGYRRGLRQLSAGASILALAAALAPPVAAAAAAARTLQFRYEARVSDVPAGAQGAYLWIPYPPDSEDQSIAGLRVETSLPYEIVTEPKHGNRAVRVALRPGPGTQGATLSFEVTRNERVRRPAPPGPAAATLPPDVGIWLQPDRRVPIDGPIRGWAEETVAKKATDLERGRAIYDYVVTTLKYDKSGSGWGNGDIAWACDAKRGNCSDFHAVFIGYSRAVGIPARFEIGFPLPADRSEGEIAGYHCWAQFFVRGFGWVPVDASEAQKHPEKRDYFFGAHDANRVLFSLGRDLVLPGMKGAPLNFFIYPYAEADGAALTSIERTVSFRDLAPSRPVATR